MRSLITYIQELYDTEIKELLRVDNYMLSIIIVYFQQWPEQYQSQFVNTKIISTLY